MLYFALKIRGTLEHGVCISPTPPNVLMCVQPLDQSYAPSPLFQPQTVYQINVLKLG